jgi:hypothetical protein
MTETEQWLAQRAYQRRQTALVRTAGATLLLGLSALVLAHNIVVAALAFGLTAVCGGLWLVRRVRHGKR